MKNVLLYQMIMEGYDFGPFVTKLVIAFNKDEPLKAEDFSVTVTKQGGAFDSAPIVEGTRKVTSVKISGNYVTLELEVHPSCGVANGFRVETKDEGEGKFHVGNQWAYPYKHTLTWKGTTFELERTGIIMPLADSFVRGRFAASDDTTVLYGSFVPPEAEVSKRPLIIWLHGAGEGNWFGTQDVSIALIGNKVVSFVDKPIQSMMGGAYVLIPQISTMWMDDGTETYTKNGTTRYETALTELIQRYLADHPNVDTERIFIGGCSNGGFMTMRMILSQPKMFAAAFPVCQGFNPEWITDEQIKNIAHIPIWQIHAKNDTIVPFAWSESAHKRLLEANAKNVQCTWYNNIADLTGLWLDEKGNPWEYDGHWAWIPVFNNAPHTVINGKETSLFEWLSMQKK